MLWRVFPQIIAFYFSHTEDDSVCAEGGVTYIFSVSPPPPPVTPPPSNDFCCGVGGGPNFFLFNIAKNTELPTRYGGEAERGSRNLFRQRVLVQLRTTVNCRNYPGREYNHFTNRCGSGSGRISINLSDPVRYPRPADPDPAPFLITWKAKLYFFQKIPNTVEKYWKLWHQWRWR